MNKQRMAIVTSLTQPDGRERVVRMKKQRMPIFTSLTQFGFVQRQSMTKDSLGFTSLTQFGFVPRQSMTKDNL